MDTLLRSLKNYATSSMRENYIKIRVEKKLTHYLHIIWDMKYINSERKNSRNRIYICLIQDLNTDSVNQKRMFIYVFLSSKFQIYT